MTFGFQTFDATGALQDDTSTALGGVVGDYRQYAISASGETVNYPQWAGFIAVIIMCGSGGEFVSVSNAGSYPVVTVTTPNVILKFCVLVY